MMVMMMYANLFSSAFTALGLVVTLEISDVLVYFAANPSILPHIFIMAICSAVGQLFIFYTIKRYGPLVFATIQTVRQFLSVVLSIIFFAHPLNFMSAVGIATVFIALGVQIAAKWFGRAGNAPQNAKPLSPTPPNAEDGNSDADHKVEKTENTALLRTARQA